MKNYSLLALIVLVFVTIGCSQTQERPGNGQRMDPAEAAKRRSEMMVKQLGLTDQQAKQVEEINLNFTKRQRDMRGEFRGDREAMRENMLKANEEMNEELKKVFTEDQWTKWEEIKDDFQRRGPRRQRGQGES